MNEETKPPARRAEVVTDSEARITGYVDTSVNQLRTDLNLRLDRQQEDQRVVNERMLSKLDQLLDKMVEHFNGPGHPVQNKEMENLHQRVNEHMERPWKTWLWVTGAIGLLVMLCNFAMGSIGFLLAILPHLHLHLQ